MSPIEQLFYILVGLAGGVILVRLFKAPPTPAPFVPSERDRARYAATVERLDRLEQRADISIALDRDRERWN